MSACQLLLISLSFAILLLSYFQRCAKMSDHPPDPSSTLNSAMSDNGEMLLEQIISQKETSAEKDEIDLSHDEDDVNRESATPETNEDPSQSDCHNCHVRKIFRNNLCYRCRGTSGEHKNSGRSQHYKQSDEEFISKVSSFFCIT